MMYSAYKLNKQGVYSIDVLLSQFGTSLLFQVQSQVLLLDLHTGFSGSNKVVWHSHLFQNFPQFIVIHTVKGFGIVNKAEIDVFLESLAFSMIQQMLAI